MSTRRLPFYFLIDTSASVEDANAKACRNFICAIMDSLRGDPYALETAHLSIIKFGDETKVVTPLIDLCAFELSPATFVTGCSLGGGLSQLVASVRSDLVPSTDIMRGDWRPNVVLWLTAEPTDDFEKGLRELDSVKSGKRFAVVSGSVAKATTNRLKDSGFIVVSTESGEDAFRLWYDEVYKRMWDCVEADIDDVGDASF
jgi:uncharacterized protein YegL